MQNHFICSCLISWLLAMLIASPVMAKQASADSSMTSQAEDTELDSEPEVYGPYVPNDTPLQPDLYMGWLEIPDISISVRLYDASDLDDDARQAVTDAEDAAAWIDESDKSEILQPLVADHTEQGFVRLEKAVPGQTLAFVQKADGTSRLYRCLRNIMGRNDGTELTDGDGQKIMQENLDGFTTYTCLEDWEHVRIVEWEPVSDSSSQTESLIEESSENADSSAEKMPS